MGIGSDISSEYLLIYPYYKIYKITLGSLRSPSVILYNLEDPTIYNFYIVDIMDIDDIIIIDDIVSIVC